MKSLSSKKKLSVILISVLAAAVLIAASILFMPENYEGKTVILHTNDVHGAIENYAYVSGLKNELEEKGAEVILVDAGDFSQGTNYVNCTHGLNAVTMMNTAGYDIAVPGNHEFDFGYEQLKDNADYAEFTMLCTNVTDETSSAIFAPNCVYETSDGIKIGFFGLSTPQTQTSANPAMISNLRFLSGKALVSEAEKQVKALSDTDLVICVAHLGVDSSASPNRSDELFNSVGGIDFIIDGHSHTVMTKGSHGEPIQSAGTALDKIGMIVIDNAKKKIISNKLVSISDKSPADEKTKAEAVSIIDELTKEYSQVIAVSEVELNGDRAPGNRTKETNLGDLTADALRWAVIRNGCLGDFDESNVVAIENGGGIRDWIHKGDITVDNIITVFPFANTLTVVYVTGEQLLEALEASTFSTPEAVGGFPQISGMTVRVDTSKKYDANKETYPSSTYYGPNSINRVTVTSVNGKAFDRKAVYAVVTNNFCAEGGDTYYAFANAENKTDTGLLLEDVITDYITEELNGTVGSQYEKPQNRLSVK